MTRRRHNPVVSFGPELMALLIKGSTEPVTVACDSARNMKYLQQRIHMLRGAMTREKHPQTNVVQRARTSRQWDLDKDGQPCNFRLLVEPQDMRFRSAIAAAGVDINPVEMEDLLADTALPDVPVDPTIESAHTDDDSVYSSFLPRKD